MNFVFSFVLVAFLNLISILFVTSSSDVLVLTDSDFDTRIQSYEIALVKFYAPWCGHCKRFAPEFEKAATQLTQTESSVTLIRVDCTVETKTCQKNKVNGYPTLSIFKHGVVSSEYNGPRDSNGIVKHMLSNAVTSSIELKSYEDIETFLSEKTRKQHSVIGFFNRKRMSNSLYVEFRRVADKLNSNISFAHCLGDEVNFKYLKEIHEESIVIFQPKHLQNNLEPIHNVYKGKADAEQIQKFIQSNLHGICGHRTMVNRDQFKMPFIVVYYNVDYEKNAKTTNYIRNRVIKVAQRIQSENIQFSISNSKEFETELIETFGVVSIDTIAGKYVMGVGVHGEKYKFDGDFSVENLEGFVRDLLGNKLEAYVKSEPVPDYDELRRTSGEKVVRVVGKNFEQIVNDATKDVLIELYAPWCGHCKSFASKYEELAKKLADESDIVIAKMDATANDVPAEFKIQGFPTIYFAPKNSKKSPQKYEGVRDVKDLIKYLAKHATNKMKGFNRGGDQKENKNKKSKSSDL